MKNFRVEMIVNLWAENPVIAKEEVMTMIRGRVSSAYIGKVEANMTPDEVFEMWQEAFRKDLADFDQFNDDNEHMVTLAKEYVDAAVTLFNDKMIDAAQLLAVWDEVRKVM